MGKVKQKKHRMHVSAIKLDVKKDSTKPTESPVDPQVNMNHKY